MENTDVLCEVDVFKQKIKIEIAHTDAAGVLFFAEQLRIVHSIYEAFMEHIGCPLHLWVKKGQCYLPIVHAESDYMKPLFWGDLVDVSVSKVHIGTTSYQIHYLLERGSEAVGKAHTIHVSVDCKKRDKIPLPDLLRDALGSYLKYGI